MSTYPDHGSFPTPMSPSFYQNQSTYNEDGSLLSNPVVDASYETHDTILYLLRRLQSKSTLSFQGQAYTVYSAIPAEMTISFAYQNTARYYDKQVLSTGTLDFPSSPPTQINGGQPTTISAVADQSPCTGEMVYLALPDKNNLLYIPFLQLTRNVYWTLDSYLGQPGYDPQDPIYHLIAYGWALDPQLVNQSIFLQKLNSDGGTSQGVDLIQQAAIPFNYWKHLVEGVDKSGSSYKETLFQKIKATPEYPFPPRQYQTGNYPSWLQYGIYLPIQPMPGFQRNLVRWYTAWGAWNELNNTSDLFVRADGTIELPAYDAGAGNWKRYPLVTQTWDDTHRYTLINTMTQVVPSTYDLYPGSEVYFASNAYLPQKAGVIPAYKDYGIYDSSSPNPTFRQTDLWLGLKGDTPTDVMRWATAEGTEPGGQANKPFMLGADSSHRGGSDQYTHTCRLQSSNSFFIARLRQEEAEDKLYSASLWVDSGAGYQLGATIRYEWQPWDIGLNGTWQSSSDEKGACVPQITVAQSLTDMGVNTALGENWQPTARVMGWAGRPYQAKDNNQLGQPPQMYTLSASSLGDVRYVILLSDKPVQDTDHRHHK
jgi:hypothetical protein